MNENINKGEITTHIEFVPLDYFGRRIIHVVMSLVVLIPLKALK